MNFDPKAIRRALMVAKDIATKIDPGFAAHNLPMPPQGVPLERAKGGPIKTIEGADRERNLAEFMRDAHPAVLNQDGTPKVLYHGTRSDVQEFKKKGIKPNFTSPQKHLGHFFTDDTKYANQYAQGAEEGIGGNVMPVYLALKNPKIEPLSRINDIEGYWPHWKTKAYKQDLLGQGHDGIIFSGLNRVGSPITEYVAFDPSQIKSAVGNVGAFDPASPDIAKAEGGEVEAAGMGINVRSDNKAGIRYADEIVDGNKKYETRDSDSLRPYVGKRVAIVRTGEGPAKAIGEVTVGEPIVADRDMFHKMRPHHLVPAGSAFDIKPGSQKYLYPMHDPMRFDTEKGVGAGIIARKVLSKAEGGAVDEEVWPYSIPEENMLQTHHAQRYGQGLPEGVVPEDMFDPRSNPGIEHGTGPFTYAAEHIGDLVHRLSYVPRVGGGVEYGIEAAYTKARRNYDLRQDRLNESLKSNYRFYKDNGRFNGTFNEYLKKFDQAANRYADAYRLIPVHTELQKFGRDAAVALGERNFPKAQQNLNEIKRRLENENAHEEYWRPLSQDIKKAEGGAVDDEMQARNLNPMGMYSAAAEAARNLPQERGTLQQMLATMKGVKPDELRWAGVQDKFAGQKTVTRDELAQHFEQNLPPLRENVRVESAIKGPDAKYGQYTLPGGQNYREVVMHMRPEDVEQTYPGEKMSYKSSHWQEPNVVAHLRLKDRDFAPAKKPPKPDTQANIMMNTPLDPSGQALRPVDAWSTPTPGLVVTKSMESDEKGQYRVTHLGTGLNATGGSAYPFHQAMDAAKRLGEIWDGWTQDPDTVKAWAKDNGKLAREALKKASNPFAKKILHIEELQSDWAQQGRDAGFRNAAALEKAKAEMDKWKAEMAKEYATSLHNRLSSGQPLQPFEKEEILQGHYQDLNSIRNYFERNEFNVVEQPLENDEHGLFLNYKDGDPVDEDELIKNLGSSALYDLSRMRKSFYEINNFDKKAKEDPEFRDHIINLHVAGLSPQELALHFGQRAIEKTEELEKAVVAGAGHDEGPYVTNTNQWTDLGLKRALVEAARGGYDKLIWTPGEAQVDRYKLSNFIDSLEYKKSDDGTYHLMGSRNGRGILSEKATEKELPNVVGREMAKKIMEGHGEPKDPNRPDESSRMIRGLDLNVGGKGMREYYNSILPRRLMALAQEHDPEAQIKPLKSATGKIKNLPSLDITPRMRDSILKRGFKAFKRGGAVQAHLFHHHDEPKSPEVPIMDREKTIRRALMIAKADGGKLTGTAKELPEESNIQDTNNPKRILINAEGKGGVRGIVVPRHMWEGGKKVTGMRVINKARADVYGSENRDPLTIGQIGKIHKETLDEHFAKPIDQQIASENAALKKLRKARHISEDANTLDTSEKLDTVRHETDDQGRTYEAYGSKGVAGHAVYTSGFGPNQKQIVLNTCPGQTVGCGGGVSPQGIVDTMKGTCFAPTSESRLPAAAVRRACHAQAKHDPAMTRDWILSHVGSLRNAANLADKNNQVVLFRPNVVDESDTSSRYVISNLNKQRSELGKPGIVANSYGKTNELHDPENGYFVTYSNAGPKTKLGYSVSENISRDKQRARATISATDAAGRDFQNEQGNNTPPKNSYMVTDVKRGSDLNKAMEKSFKYAKYWSTGRMPNELSPEEQAEGPEGHFDGEGNPTTPDQAHFGHRTLNGRRYDYQNQHILHPRLVNVPERRKNEKTGKIELVDHLIPTDSRFKDDEFLPKDRFMTKNGKEAGAILMTTPTTSTSNLGHQTSFTHNVNDDHIDYAKQNNGEYQIDPPEAQEASAGREYVPPQEIKFRADGGAVDGEYITDDLAGFPERSFAVQMHNAHRHEEYNDDHHHPRRPINNAVAPNVDRALQLTSRMGILPGMIPPYGRR